MEGGGVTGREGESKREKRLEERKWTEGRAGLGRPEVRRQSSIVEPSFNSPLITSKESSVSWNIARPCRVQCFQKKGEDSVVYGDHVVEHWAFPV